MDIATPVDQHRIFDDPWCPLYGKIPDVLNGSGDELTGQCIRIIEESRKIWMCASISEEKLKTAKELWELFRTHHNLVSNGHTQNKSITTESICETIINETKKLSISGLDGITDAEILAIYTIHVVFSTLKDLWEPLGKMEIDNILYYLYSSPLLDRDACVSAQIYIALLLLSQAKKMANQIHKKTVDKIIPFFTPEGAKWSDLEMSFDEINSEIVRVTIKGKTEKKTYAEMGFKDIKTGRPTKLWEMLLEFRKGAIMYTQRDKEKVEKDISRLRKSLKEYFRIEDNPINLKHGYEPAFKVNVIEKSNRSVHSFSNYEAKEENY